MFDIPAMNKHDLILTVTLTSVATLASFALIIWLCICCYRSKDDDSDDELPQVAQYQYRSVDQNEPQEPVRSDVKQLTKHPPYDSRQKSPLIPKKSIK